MGSMETSPRVAVEEPTQSRGCSSQLMSTKGGLFCAARALSAAVVYEPGWHPEIIRDRVTASTPRGASAEIFTVFLA
jgi:hypothetical protein